MQISHSVCIIGMMCTSSLSLYKTKIIVNFPTRIRAHPTANHDEWRHAVVDMGHLADHFPSLSPGRASPVQGVTVTEHGVTDHPGEDRQVVRVVSTVSPLQKPFRIKLSYLRYLCNIYVRVCQIRLLIDISTGTCQKLPQEQNQGY